MDPVTVRNVLEATGGVRVAGDETAVLRAVSTDSRTLKEGDFFIPLKGERYDGHDYCAQAARRGCAGFIYSRDIPESDERDWAAEGLALVRVRDTLQGLQELARWYRKRFTLPVVAVTGSNGKTTTKEMISAAAAGRFSVRCNEGTINNQIGVPLTVLALEAKNTLAVVEMGMNARGEIGRLAEIAEPDIGVVTNVGPAHLEFLGNIENVASAKAELLEVMAASSGSEKRVAVLNADDPLVSHMAERLELDVRKFGMRPGADVQGEEVSMGLHVLSMVMSFRRSARRERVTLPLMGRHNAYNALAAAAVCELLGMEPAEIAASMAAVRMPRMRMEVSRMSGFIFINDAYNANPASMREAVETLRATAMKGRRFLVMGDMLELGPSASAAHRDIGRLAAESGIDFLITVGALSALAAEAAREAGMEGRCAITCADPAEAAAAIRGMAREGDVVLLKASRRVGLERVLQELAG